MLNYFDKDVMLEKPIDFEVLIEMLTRCPIGLQVRYYFRKK